jgi:integrase
VAAATGNDPELDSLILRLHTETACRRGGALALRPQDLDPEQCLVMLREIGETVRWQPVSPTLMGHLQRHAPPEGALLRYHNGKPLTYRRYDHLWQRIGRYLPWVATQGISTHWLRHTTGRPACGCLLRRRVRARPGCRRRARLVRMPAALTGQRPPRGAAAVGATGAPNGSRSCSMFWPPARR